MPLDREADYSFYLYTCNRCRSCAVDRTLDMRPLCPAYSKYGFFAYSGGGKGYVAQGILEGKVAASPETAQVAMSCLLCGACAKMCPPGFDTQAFIRDLRDEIVSKGHYVNDAHKKFLEKARLGNPWGKKSLPADIPRFTGKEELLIYLGCAERSRFDLVGHLGKILDAAGMTWGVLENELCCGAPLEDLGDIAAFEEAAAKNIEAINAAGAARVLASCPHCASALSVGYMNFGGIDAGVITLPALIAELVADGRIAFKNDCATTATFHDPCKLARFLDDVDSARTIIGAMQSVALIEMPRSGDSGWCCGSGAWASIVAPDLAQFAVNERIAEARKSGAEYIITACSYCTGFLKKASQGKIKVTHLAEITADRLQRND